ncbi:DME family drug/metabolite transporter [Actinocorallia herbida]|uniref:DME family drug/metabolite transporter n=1 Tax=Actinocorallia herbida TaxID=58109 RepID=A0A3N1DAG6_9ACTN|nr:EamA family transporter [Actinocorallia herbida]ROO90489.1 DME family drug/metabolite transporter [Actinocorallia herbida]
MPAARLLSGPMPILAAGILWGTTGTAASFAPAGADAAAVGSAALVLGGLLLFLTTRGSLRLAVGGTPARKVRLLLGAVTVAGYPVTFYPAVSMTGVAVATVIALGSAPVFAGLLGWCLGHGRPSARWMWATGAAVAGCGALVLGPALDGSGARVDLVGVALALVAGASYAAYSLIAGRLISEGEASSPVMGVMFGGAALLVLPVVLATGPGWIATGAGLSITVYLAFFTSFLAYRLFGIGLRNTSAETATVLTLSEPAVAALLGVVVLDEYLPPLSWAGLAVLALALAVLTTSDG